MSYQPYSPNAQGFTEALIDLKTNYPGQITNKGNGFEAEAFENLVQGDAVFSRASDGKLGNFQSNFYVYGLENKECKVCKNTIKRIVQNGRSTFYCDKCQG